MTLRKRLEQKRDEDAKSAHDMIDDQLALKWEYVAAYKAGAAPRDELLAVAFEALGISAAAIEALTLTQVEAGMGLVGKHIVVPDTLRRIREALAKFEAFLGEKGGVSE